MQDDISGLAHLKSERAFFDNQLLAESEVGYICWLDVMGVGSAMSRSLPIAANWVMKLHACALRQLRGLENEIALFQMVDGMYVWARNPYKLLDWLRGVYWRLALTFVFQEAPQHRFMPRGAIAYGRVFMGAGNHGGNHDLQASPMYLEHVLLSPALALAHDGERQSPPFGVYVDASVRNTTDVPSLRQVFWRWWRGGHGADAADVARALRAQLDVHFDWCSRHSREILYKQERIAVHRTLVNQYFGDEPELE